MKNFYREILYYDVVFSFIYLDHKSAHRILCCCSFRMWSTHWEIFALRISLSYDASCASRFLWKNFQSGFRTCTSLYIQRLILRFLSFFRVVSFCIVIRVITIQKSNLYFTAFGLLSRHYCSEISRLTNIAFSFLNQ